MFENETPYLMISSIQHFVFCKRQWALIHLEQQWSENYFTVDGNIFHEKAHDGLSFEKRKNVLISRGMPVISHELKISGECDIVEFYENPNGVAIFGRGGKYEVCPVEYKRGKEKVSDADRFQVIAQALCLEEMLCCSIEKGYLFYGETRNRVLVNIDDEARIKVKEILNGMHKMYKSGRTPLAKKRKCCPSCSLRDICMPQLESKYDVAKYIDSLL